MKPTTILYALIITIFLIGTSNRAAASELVIKYESRWDNINCRVISLTGPYTDETPVAYFEMYKLCKRESYGDEYVKLYKLPVENMGYTSPVEK